MRKNRTQGFTLIELLIVIAIIAILAAVLIPNILNARRRAQTAAAQSYARDVLVALESAQSADTTLDYRRNDPNNRIQIVDTSQVQTIDFPTFDGNTKQVDMSTYLKAPGAGSYVSNAWLKGPNLIQVGQDFNNDGTDDQCVELNIDSNTITTTQAACQ